ncbi:ankyrin repeat-containing domain protein, partial [Fusarium oxysporum Fo47]
RTLLHWLAMNGVAFLIPKLIETGFDVNAVESDFRTPLHLAVIGNHFPAVKCLVENGANVHAEDLEHMLP